ncbi:MAG: sensor signal transduction histidine kinase, partial [Gemmatimonadetes bacterium]|nr:sensor signal transduction histidine kinase [Gemmatimonadota bacterium]
MDPFDRFSARVDGTRRRAHDLQRRSRAAAADEPLMDEALETLQSSLEELRVSEEELRVQTEELASSRMLLEAERERYRELFDLAPDPYLVTDARGVVSEANHAAATLLGVPADALCGRPLAVFVPAGERAAFREGVAR